MTTECLTIKSTVHGKYSYKAVAKYIAGTTKDGKPIWLAGPILAEATTSRKIARLAEELSEELGIPFIVGVRHYSPRGIE